MSVAIRSLSAILVTAGVLLTAMPAGCAVIDRIVVVVNKEVITQNEIDRALAPIYNQYRTIYPADKLMKMLEEARQAVIAQLIHEKLIVGEAKKQGIEVTEKEIDEKLAEAQARFASAEMFRQALKEQRMTIDDMRERLKSQLMSRKLVDRTIGARIVVTPGQLQNYYDKHKSEFTQPAEVKARNILIKLKPGINPEKTAELAKEIDKRLREGGDFSELAKIYSEGPGAADGGMMGFVRRGDLMPEAEDIIFSLKEGETSHVVQSGMGYHFFKVEEVRPARALSLSEARRFIEDAIFNEKAQEKMKGWMEELKNNAYIAFK